MTQFCQGVDGMGYRYHDDLVVGPGFSIGMWSNCVRREGRLRLEPGIGCKVRFGEY